jgi:hypothetical protein
MKKSKDREDNKFIPKETPAKSVRFVPFEQDISRDANGTKPFIPLTIEDALARTKKEDK